MNTTTPARLRSPLLRIIVGLAVAQIGSAAVFAQDQPDQQIPWPTESWQTSTPAAAGLNPAPLATLHERIASGDFGFVDRMFVVRGGKAVVNERYERDYKTASAGRDLTPHQYNYSHPDWHPYYQGQDVHSLQSVTKSVTSALIGIAIRRGEIESLDQKLLSFFQNYDLSKVDARLQQATLDDLLTMRTGIEWHETDRPLDETNTTIQLEGSDDWIQFTLDQPLDAGPGKKWTYNSGGSHLMSGVIKQATGRFVDEYAEEHLFGPLGIKDYHWKKTPQGFPDTEGGLYLEAEQLAKIGYLYLQDGVWEGERILPEDWVANSVAARVENVNSAGFGYGYQWWRIDRLAGDDPKLEVWAGLGYGGQFLIVIPKLEMVGVVNSWNIFGRPQASILPAFVTAMVKAASTPPQPE